MSKFLTGFKFAWAGVRHLLRSERNAKVQLGVAIAVIASGFLFKIKALEWCAVLFCITLVLALEAMNTALEALADAVHPEQDPLVGRAKDLAAGAVLIAAIGAALVGAIVFLPYLGIRF